jgi:hypothetical protein
MQEKPDQVKMVSFTTRATKHHAKRLFDKLTLTQEGFEWASTPVLEKASEFKIYPLLYWYDSSHIATLEYYTKFIFAESRLWHRGGFIEDELA